MPDYTGGTMELYCKEDVMHCFKEFFYSNNGNIR